MGGVAEASQLDERSVWWAEQSGGCWASSMYYYPAHFRQSSTSVPKAHASSAMASPAETMTATRDSENRSFGAVGKGVKRVYHLISPRALAQQEDRCNAEASVYSSLSPSL